MEKVRYLLTFDAWLNKNDIQRGLALGGLSRKLHLLIHLPQRHVLTQYSHSFSLSMGTGIEPYAGLFAPFIRTNPGLLLAHKQHLFQRRNVFVQFQFLAQIKGLGTLG